MGVQASQKPGRGDRDGCRTRRLAGWRTDPYNTRLVSCGGADINAGMGVAVKAAKKRGRMERELRNKTEIHAGNGAEPRRRPLIGVPTGREKSQRFFGLSLFIMNQTYVRVVEQLGALPVMIPLHMSEETLRGIFARMDGLLLPGGEDIDPSFYDEARDAQLGPTDKERDRTELNLTRWALEEGMPILGVCRGVQISTWPAAAACIRICSASGPTLASMITSRPSSSAFAFRTRWKSCRRACWHTAWASAMR